MAEKKRYYWLKLQHDFFNSKRIKKLRKLGADFVIIYLKLQLLSIKNDGRLEFSGLENTFAEELALDINEDVDKIQLTLSYLQSCGLLEADSENEEYFFPYVINNTGSETASAQRAKEYRAKLTDEQKDAERERARIAMRELRAKRRENVTDCYERVTNVEKEKEKEKEIEIEIEGECERETTNVVCSQSEPIDYQSIVNEFNSICIDYPKVKSLSDARKKAIRARLNTYSRDDITRVFELAQESDFLKGKNNRNWQANFDWLLKDANMAKVLDGNYQNKSNNHYDGSMSAEELANSWGFSLKEGGLFDE